MNDQVYLEAERESRAMFICRLENMRDKGQPWLTIDAVLALLNDCDYLACLNLPQTGIIVE